MGEFGVSHVELFLPYQQWSFISIEKVPRRNAGRRLTSDSFPQVFFLSGEECWEVEWAWTMSIGCSLLSTSQLVVAARRGFTSRPRESGEFQMVEALSGLSAHFEVGQPLLEASLSLTMWSFAVGVVLVAPPPDAFVGHLCRFKQKPV